jgi:signal peptidase I
MTPLLSDQEAIVINRLVYHFEPIHRREVVVFRYPLEATQLFIKRIAGVPGDTVQIRQGLVYVKWELGFRALRPNTTWDLSAFGPIMCPVLAILYWVIAAAARMIREFSALSPGG